MKELPSQVFYTGTGGSFTVAGDRAKDIKRYLDKVVACMEKAATDDLGSYERGGALRQADEYLNVIISYAKHTRELLRENDYSPH